MKLLVRLFLILICSSSLGGWTTPPWPSENYARHDNTLALQCKQSIDERAYVIGVDSAWYWFDYQMFYGDFSTNIDVWSRYERDAVIEIKTWISEHCGSFINPWMNDSEITSYMNDNNGNFPMVTVTGIIAHSSIPTNYFTQTPFRMLSGYGQEGIITTEYTYGSFTTKDYGWKYLPTIINFLTKTEVNTSWTNAVKTLETYSASSNRYGGGVWIIYNYYTERCYGNSTNRVNQPEPSYGGEITLSISNSMTISQEGNSAPCSSGSGSSYDYEITSLWTEYLIYDDKLLSPPCPSLGHLWGDYFYGDKGSESYASESKSAYYIISKIRTSSYLPERTATTHFFTKNINGSSISPTEISASAEISTYDTSICTIGPYEDSNTSSAIVYRQTMSDQDDWEFEFTANYSSGISIGGYCGNEYDNDIEIVHANATASTSGDCEYNQYEGPDGAGQIVDHQYDVNSSDTKTVHNGISKPKSFSMSGKAYNDWDFNYK